MKVHPINDEAEKNLDSYILQNSQEEASLITQNSVNKMTLAENRNELIKLRKEKESRIMFLPKIRRQEQAQQIIMYKMYYYFLVFQLIILKKLN